jgi:hypothetical protein
MNFSFLNPLFWLGALALAAPVWLHLRRKATTTQLKFSALRFLDDQPVARRDPFRLRDWLLFLLRALALLAVVAAFAWPYRHTATEMLIRESRVYILDNTLSHQANDAFAHDRDAMLKEIARAGRDVQIAVIELTSSPRVLVSFGDDRATINDKLKDLAPSFQRGSYLAAFHQANNLLANSFGAHKRIVLYGDNQANQWSENMQSPPFLQNVEVELPKTPATNAANLSLSEPHLQRIFLGDKSLVDLTMQLAHTGEAKSADVTLRVNGQLIFDRNLQFEKDPAPIVLHAEWEADPKLWLRGEASLTGEPDALAADNKLFFSLAPLAEGRVALLAQSPYLRSALSPDVMRGQWAMRILEPSLLGDEIKANNDDDVLCLESNYLQSSDARKLLHRYLENGRGVLLFINRVSPAINGYLRELGFEPEPTPDTPAVPEHIKYVMGNHPIFHPFVSSDYGNLTEVKVSKFVHLKAPTALPLILSDGGTGLFFQETKSKGKLFVAAFGMDRDQTSWPVHQTFIPFLDLTLQAARAEDPTPLNFEPGEVGLIQLPPDSKAHEIVLHDDHHELARATITQGHAQLAMPLSPGLYTMTCDASNEPQKIFSVNPSPKESDLTYVKSPEAITNWQLAAASLPKNSAATKSFTPPSIASIWRQQFWWWLVVAGLLALLVETGLAALRRENR